MSTGGTRANLSRMAALKKTIKTGTSKPSKKAPSKKHTDLSYAKLDPKNAKKSGRTGK